MKGFIVSFLFYVISTEPEIAADSPSTLQFTCDNEGNITDLSSGNFSLSDFVILDGDHICRLNDSSCSKGKSELRVIHVKTINKQLASFIIGGKDAQFYDLKCKPTEFNGRAIASLQIAPSPATYIPNEHTFAPTNTTIDLTIEKYGNGHKPDAVKLGEKLTLKFKGPDTAILDNSWKKDDLKHNIISITMYAFRFPESTKVEIECSAHFCPESDTTCQKKCWKNNSNTIGRKRRDAFENSHGKDYYMKKVSTFFTVLDDSGNSNRSSGTSSMNTFLYLATIAITLGYFV